MATHTATLEPDRVLGQKRKELQELEGLFEQRTKIEERIRLLIQPNPAEGQAAAAIRTINARHEGVKVGDLLERVMKTSEKAMTARELVAAIKPDYHGAAADPYMVVLNALKTDKRRFRRHKVGTRGWNWGLAANK